MNPKKSLGQHWLHDVPTLQAMCDAAQINAQDVVLEIGPGLGTLTKQLLQQAKKVIAVEFDHILAQTLLDKKLHKVGPRADRLEVIEQDILKYDFTTLPKSYKLVANIPYYITAHLLRVLSETSNPPRIAALLVQKEVAERIAAEPGNMSTLAVASQYYFYVSVGQIVPAKLFIPPPKVDSQILVLKLRQKPLFENLDTNKYFRIVRAGFSQRRKKLRSSLSGGLQLEKAKIDELLERAGINGNLRAQDLDHAEWYKIYQTL